jgi:hypothetical protein
LIELVGAQLDPDGVPRASVNADGRTSPVATDVTLASVTPTMLVSDTEKEYVALPPGATVLTKNWEDCVTGGDDNVGVVPQAVAIAPNTAGSDLRKTRVR